MNHCAIEHYPQGVGGFRSIESKKLNIGSCSTAVCTDRTFRNDKTNGEKKNYKDYKDLYPEWSIPRDSSLETSCYWKRFMAKFNSDLAKKYKAKEGMSHQHGTSSRRTKHSNPL